MNDLISMTVNGRTVEVNVSRDGLLCDVLRDQLDLTGTKIGCREGVCGSCDVLFEGEVVRSCLVLGMQASGASIQTVEGLVTNGELSELQRSFVDTGAVQCGFCIPGILMNATNLLARQPNASEQEIALALGGNLCRCSGYVKVVDAIARCTHRGVNGAARTEVSTMGQTSENDGLRTVGLRVPKVDAPDKVTGGSQYIEDMRFPDLLIARMVRSTSPHARIKAVNDMASREVDGVLEILSSANVKHLLPDLAPYDPGTHDFDRKPPFASMPGDFTLFDEVVRYQGEPVAAILAATDSAALEAASLLQVEYEDLPPVLTPAHALAADAPVLHIGATNNVAVHISEKAGDIDRAFAAAAAIVSRRFSTSKQKQAQLEPTCCVAVPSADGSLTIFTPSQSPHRARQTLAHMFGLPLTQMRIITPTIGGAFGKGDALTAEPYAAALALITRRPVKVRFDRTEDFVGTESRHPSVADVETAVADDGSITALRACVVLDAGAYLSHSPRIARLLSKQLRTIYDPPNIDIDVKVVFTNTPVSGAFRGYGGPQAAFPLEHMIDVGAAAVGVDPLTARVRMLERLETQSPGSRRGVLECIEVGRRAIEWDAPREGQEGRARGVGMACLLWKSGTASTPGALDRSSASVQVNSDGSADVRSAASDLGTGIQTTLGQIAAEILGIPFDMVRVTRPDTAVTPFDSGAFASRSLYRAGQAVHAAASEARRRILTFAGDLMESAPADLELSNGLVYVQGAASKNISLADLLNRGLFEGQDFRGDGDAPATSAASSAAQFVEVDVDVETGQVRVLRLVAVQDVGRAINPTVVEGQIEGAAYQGLGYAMSEDLVIDDHTGATLTGTFMDYRMPTVMDGPSVEAILVERPDPTGPFGARGAGEPSIIITAPAVANAIMKATGVSITHLPMSPERVYTSLSTECAPAPDRRVGGRAGGI